MVVREKQKAAELTASPLPMSSYSQAKQKWPFCEYIVQFIVYIHISVFVNSHPVPRVGNASLYQKLIADIKGYNSPERKSELFSEATIFPSSSVGAIEFLYICKTDIQNIENSATQKCGVRTAWLSPHSEACTSSICWSTLSIR